jgi:CDP-diacylglycerol--serine O-phosphatidyltransferase
MVPVFVVAVLFVALLISYPWQVLTLGVVVYLGCLPLGWLSYREYVRQDLIAAQSSTTPANEQPLSPDHAPGERDGDQDRPPRLN